MSSKSESYHKSIIIITSTKSHKGTEGKHSKNNISALIMNIDVIQGMSLNRTRYTTGIGPKNDIQFRGVFEIDKNDMNN